MKCLINQAAGLGDILFCLKIGIKFCEIYDEVIWPLIPEYNWLPQYLNLPPNLNMKHTLDQNFTGRELFDIDDILQPIQTPTFKYFPLHAASRNYPGEKIMNSKYRLVDMKFNDWADFVKIKRNLKKEELLLQEFPNRFNLICDLFGSPPNTQTAKMYIPNNEWENKFIYIKPGFTPFDWMGVIERAETLHLVDTVYSFLVEKSNIKATELVLYTRNRRRTWEETRHLFTTKWKYV